VSRPFRLYHLATVSSSRSPAGPRGAGPGSRLRSFFSLTESPVVSPDDCAPEKCWENCVNTSAPRPAFSREICELATQDGHHRIPYNTEREVISRTSQGAAHHVGVGLTSTHTSRAETGGRRATAHRVE